MRGISVLLAHIHFIQSVFADLRVHSKNISKNDPVNYQVFMKAYVNNYKRPYISLTKQ
jgi:hypothetical protein